MDTGITSEATDTKSRGKPCERPEVTMKGGDMLYSIEDTPPLPVCVLLGFQHLLTAMGSTITVAFVITPAFCVTDDVIKAKILNTIIFVGGIVTLIQSTLGIRLPILQSASFSLLVPTFAIMKLPQFVCPDADQSESVFQGVDKTNVSLAEPDVTTATLTAVNSSFLFQTNQSEVSTDWTVRMLEINGGIIAASLVQVALGGLGLIGYILKFISPLVVAVTIGLIGISLFQVVADYSSQNWYVAFMTMALIILFSQYLTNINIPCLYPTVKDKRIECNRASFPLFKLFPVILAIMTSWAICAILTATDAFPNNPSHFAYTSRTDGSRVSTLKEAPWFSIPYPFQWGWPTFSLASSLGMFSGIIAGIIESIGDYYACANASGAPPPPLHAINRGIMVEGIGCVLAGIWGCGSGTTSYSENIGAITITRVGSRRVVQCAALVMVVVGVFGKFGAIFVTIPDPVIGGMFMVMFGMVAAVGVSNLQLVNMNKSRNLLIFGFSVLLGLALPSWARQEGHVVRTGSEVVDQLVRVLLSTNMFVGGVMACFLDNTIPGSDEERGLHEWLRRASLAGATPAQDAACKACYDLPLCTNIIRSQAWTRYVPFLPGFEGKCMKKPDTKCCCCHKKYHVSTDQYAAESEDFV